MRRFAQRVFACAVAAAALWLGAGTALAELSSKEWKEAEKALKAAAGAGDHAGMVTAIEKVGQDGSKRAVELIVEVGAAIENAKVYDAVKAALQGMTDADAVDAMVKMLDKKGSPAQWSLRCVLLEGLVPHQGEAVTTGMTECLKDKVPYVISAAAKALGKRKDPKAMPALIAALEDLEKNKDVPWIDTKQALTDITGQDFPDSVGWRDYWKAVGDTFDPTKDRGDKEKSTTVLREDEASSFFEEKIVAKRIMFVIDISGSMEVEDPPVEGKGGGKRIERVKNELINTLKGLKGDVQFNVLAYSHTLKSWKPIKAGAALNKATPANKQDAINWVGALKADGATHTDDALKKGFELLEVNTIVLLSDGAPARVNQAQTGTEPIDPAKILEDVRGMNRIRGVKIHTFCFKVFEGQPGMEPLLDFMRKLAEENGGKMTLIS